MISLLHEKNYEMLGNIEVRQADWMKIRTIGPPRFVLETCSKSPVAKIGAFCLLMGGSEIHDVHHIGLTSWMIMGYGAYATVVSLIHQIRAWNRLEQRFNPKRADYAGTPAPN